MKKLFLVAMFSIVALFSYSQTEQELKMWEPTIKAIARIESNFQANAVSKSGKYVGYLQISPILVKECNNILGKQVYTLKDRYDIQKSKEMFVLIQRKYNPSNDVQKAIRIWNGGPKFSKASTERYYKKVMAYILPKDTIKEGL